MILVNVLQAYSVWRTLGVATLALAFGNVLVFSHEPWRFSFGLFLLTLAIVLFVSAALLAWQKFLGWIQSRLPR